MTRTEPIFTTLTLVLQHCVQNSYTER